MKLSVRKKVANGLVLCLLVPRAADTAVELFDSYVGGIKAFGAQDEFDLGKDKRGFALAQVDPPDPSGGDPSGGDPSGGDPSGGDPSGGDPSGGDPSGGDPSGYDPSAYDPSGFDPSGGDPSACAPGSTLPQLYVNAPRELLTAEDGSSDLFELTMAPDPVAVRTFTILSTRPDEAIPVPGVVEFGENSCVPRPIWVVGQNDYAVDGDAKFEINVYDEQNYLVATLPGINLDNDDYAGVAVDVLGPNALPPGDDGLFLVRVANVSADVLRKGTLVIEASDALDINDYAVALLSGDSFKGKGKMKDGVLFFDGVNIGVNDMLIVSLGVEMARASRESQSLTARFIDPKSGDETNDDQPVRSSRP